MQSECLSSCKLSSVVIAPLCTCVPHPPYLLPATASSSHGSHTPYEAVDGVLGHTSCWWSHLSTSSWWSVDLGWDVPIRKIRLYYAVSRVCVCGGGGVSVGVHACSLMYCTYLSGVEWLCSISLIHLSCPPASLNVSATARCAESS